MAPEPKFRNFYKLYITKEVLLLTSQNYFAVHPKTSINVLPNPGLHHHLRGLLEDHSAQSSMLAVYAVTSALKFVKPTKQSAAVTFLGKGISKKEEQDYFLIDSFNSI
jgi:hypothetical protein